MDWDKAIHYGRMVLAAEQVLPTGDCGQVFTLQEAGTESRFSLLVTVFASDLATASNPDRGSRTVSIGFVAQSEDGEVVIALRGTEGIHEWVHDCHFHAVACPILQDAGYTEDGFTELYLSLRTGPEPRAPALGESIATMQFPHPVTTVTVCGHSLGAALATLLAADLAANTQYTNVSLYTYASPRLGDARFVEVFQQLVPNAHRIANRADIVTETPPAILCHARPYLHVEEMILLAPRETVKYHIVCMHHMTTYMYLMMMEAGMGEAPAALHPDCWRERKRPELQSEPTTGNEEKMTVWPVEDRTGGPG